MDAATEIGRDLISKHQIQPKYGDDQADGGRDCQTRLERPNSQTRTGTEKEKIPVQLTTSRPGNLTRLIHTLALRDDHTYIPLRDHTSSITPNTIKTTITTTSSGQTTIIPLYRPNPSPETVRRPCSCTSSRGRRDGRHSASRRGRRWCHPSTTRSAFEEPEPRFLKRRRRANKRTRSHEIIISPARLV